MRVLGRSLLVLTNKDVIDELADLLNTIHMLMKYMHGSITDVVIADDELDDTMKTIGRAFALSDKPPNCIMFLYGFNISEQTDALIRQLSVHYDVPVFVDDKEMEI